METRISQNTKRTAIKVSLVAVISLLLLIPLDTSVYEAPGRPDGLHSGHIRDGYEQTSLFFTSTDPFYPLQAAGPLRDAGLASSDGR